MTRAELAALRALPPRATLHIDEALAKLDQLERVLPELLDAAARCAIDEVEQGTKANDA